MHAASTGGRRRHVGCYWHIVMAYTFIAYVVMADVAMTYVVMADEVIWPM